MQVFCLGDFKMLKILALLFFLTVQIAFGASEGKNLGAADILVNSAGTSDSNKAMATFNLNNPLMVHFFAAYENAGKMNFHQKRWANLVLEQKWEKTAHLWSVIKKSLNGSFAVTARAAYIFSLWKLGLGQTFWDEWFEMARVKKFWNSKAFQALNFSIQRDFPQNFYDWAIEVEGDSVNYLFSQLSEAHPIYDTIRAHVLLREISRRAEYAQKLFLRLPPEHPYYRPLGRSLALYYSRKGDLSSAGTVLKKMEGTILKTKNSEEIASHYLQIARLLYQNGNLDAAVVFYRKIPKGSRNFLLAREELLWALLQMGDFGFLRGELETFKMDVWREQFLPEIHLVSAIANLKLCFYGKVGEDFKLFLKNNRNWASRIENELKKANPSKPKREDFYIAKAERALLKRTQENDMLKNLSLESKTAALPAVGVQTHWLDAQKALAHSIERSKKQKSEEYRRVWRSYRVVLREAIQKMQFVKVEFMGQMSKLALRNPSEKLRGNIKTKLVASNNSAIYPFDGLIWPDEMFNLQSVTEGECL